MGYPYRCSDKLNCGKRKSLRHVMEWYIRKPKCPGCKKATLKFDPAVIRQRRKETCKCQGVHYPHRYGTWLNEREYCEGVPDPQGRALAEAMHVSSIQYMKPDDPCPF